MLYLIKMYNDKEEFYKVGRSGNVPERLKQLRKFYNCDLLWASESSLQGFDKMEYFFHKDNKSRSYKPLNPFVGDSECYTFLTPAYLRYYTRLNSHFLSVYPWHWRPYKELY